MENDSTDNKSEDNQPKLNLSFKEGQTIKVNLNIGVCQFESYIFG